MSFLLPAAFAAFAALLLPILIHLSRRSQTQRTEFAALRWLGAKLRPRRRPVLQEWLLLLLRLLLLAVVVLWLAAPVWQRSTPARDWLLVTPGVDWRGVSDLPDGDTVQRRWLAPGFPPLSAPSSSAQAVPAASLLREWDAAAPAGDRLTVLVPETLGGLDGERLRLGRAVAWRVLPGSSVPRRMPDAPLPALTLLDGSAESPAAAYFRAAFLSWQAGVAESKRRSLPQAGITGLVPDAVAVHLHPGPLPAALRTWLERGGTLMLPAGSVHATAGEWQTVWRDEDGLPLLRAAAAGEGRLLQWQRPLDPQALPLMLEPEFAEGLQRALARLPAAPERAFAADHAPLRGTSTYPTAPEPLRPWFALAAVLLFALERLLAARRGVWSTP